MGCEFFHFGYVIAEQPDCLSPEGRYVPIPKGKKSGKADWELVWCYAEREGILVGAWTDLRFSSFSCDTSCAWSNRIK
jgi:hypothetical protein